MQICVIGASGHINYLYEWLAAAPAKEREKVIFTAAAPGEEGEDITPVVEGFRSRGVKLKTYSNYSTMLDSEKPTAVVVQSRFGQNGGIVLESLQRGSHIFCEKPVTTELRELSRIGETIRKEKLHLSGMFGLRFDPAFYTAWKTVSAGILGDVQLFHGQKSYKLGRRPDYYTRRASYGGTIPWVAIHAIDWMLWYLGGTWERVCASHSRTGNGGHGDLESSGVCFFTFPGGKAGTVSSDYFRPAGAPTHGDDRIRVVGTEGIVEVRRGDVYLLREGECGERRVPLQHTRGVFADFLAGVRGESGVLVNAESSLQATQAALLAREAADTGQPVSYQTLGE